MVAHAQLASLLTETSGALILAKSLAFEQVELYVRGEGTAKWGYDTHKDVARARAGAEAFGGLTLVGAGLVGQVLVAMGVGDPRRACAALPYVAGAAAIGSVVLVLIPRLYRRRVREMIRSRIRAAEQAAGPADRDRITNEVAHMLNGYSQSLHIDGERRPSTYAVRRHVDLVLGSAALADLGESTERLRDAEWCPVSRPPD
jgi:hypothetical protein